MAIYAFDANFKILGTVAAFPVNAGTVNTLAVNLAQITKVDPVTGISYTLPDRPASFSVADMPGYGVAISLAGPLPTTTNAFPQKARATRSADMTLPSAAWTQVTWDALARNPARVGVQTSVAPAALGALKPQLAGQYLVNTSVSVLPGAIAVTGLGIRLLINGQVHSTSLASDSMATAIERSISINGVLDLQAGDSVTVEAFGVSAEAPLIKKDRSWFSLVQLH